MVEEKPVEKQKREDEQGKRAGGGERDGYNVGIYKCGREI